MKVLIGIAVTTAVVGAIGFAVAKAIKDPDGVKSACNIEKLRHLKEKFGCPCCRDNTTDPLNAEAALDEGDLLDDGNDF